ncbi:MAG TPA: metalloregulator ArsR/SmtB family transcription factor [Planctomycetes bacterium]|nr:metalloregulator ArsR/SmtB family transcription factor [Planctomycetota bacterium]
MYLDIMIRERSAVQVIDHLKLLADPNRLRILALLEREELPVQDLVAILGLGQSRVSHHLGILRSASMVEDRREGGFVWYRFQPTQEGHPLDPELWGRVRGSFQNGAVAASDRQALEKLIQERRTRRRDAHGRLAGVWNLVGQDLEKGSLRTEAFAALTPRNCVVADLGCGTGFFSRFLAARVDRVIAVDHSPEMLDAARASLPVDLPVELRCGDLASLPLESGEVDAVFANLVWHHLDDFDEAAKEMGRVLRSGGMAIISDLHPHDESWMTEEMADLRLGIDPREVEEALQRAGFEEVETVPVEDRYTMRSGGGRVARLSLFLVRGRRP